MSWNTSHHVHHTRCDVRRPPDQITSGESGVLYLDRGGGRRFFTSLGLAKLNEAGEMRHLHCWWQRFRGGSLRSWSPRGHWDPETWSSPSPGKTGVTNQISVSFTTATPTHSSLISSVQLLCGDVMGRRLQCWHKRSSVLKNNLVCGLSMTSQLAVLLNIYTAGQRDLWERQCFCRQSRVNFIWI